MPVSVNGRTVHPRKLAAVRGLAGRGCFSVGLALGKVWDFFAASQGCGLTATTSFSITNRRSLALCSNVISESR